MSVGEPRELRMAQKDSHHLKRLGGVEQGRRNEALHTALLGRSGATPELQFEARIFPGEPWPVEIVGRADLTSTGFEFTRRDPPIYTCRRLDRPGDVRIWVRADNLFILPNAPERSAS